MGFRGFVAFYWPLSIFQGYHPLTSFATPGQARKKKNEQSSDLAFRDSRFLFTSLQRTSFFRALLRSFAYLGVSYFVAHVSWPIFLTLHGNLSTVF